MILLELTFWVAFGLIIYPVAVFPLLLLGISRLAGKGRDEPPPTSPEATPFVSVLVNCFHDGDALLAKARNLAEQDYPRERMEIIFADDGSPDDSASRLEPFLGKNGRYVRYASRRGKNSVINDTVPLCRGDVIVFTDVDALLAGDAVRQLVRALYRGDRIGGVCGVHQVVSGPEGERGFDHPQKVYWSLDARIKRAESRLGSISSCYGTIYAVKKRYVARLPLSVTDDAFQAMAVVRQGKRMTFAPEARAFIRAPAKDARGEYRRRRRIVSQSLRGLWLSRSLFAVGKHGIYAVSLFTQKVLRRLIPLCLLAMLAATAVLAFDGPFWGLLFLGQLAFYGIAVGERFGWLRRILRRGPARRVTVAVFYFCVGSAGTMAGIGDFLLGRRVDTW